MKEPDRESELQMMTEVRELFHDKEAKERMTRWYEKFVPESVKLAREGAALDAYCAVPRLKGDDYASGPLNDVINSICMAAAMRCMINGCEHAVAREHCMKYAFLGSRILTCEECLPFFLPILVTHHMFPPRPDECELCLDLGVKTFREVRIVWNGFVLSGQSCEACFDKLKQEVENGEKHESPSENECGGSKAV